MQRGLYFDEFNVGDQFTTVGRTVTETDIVNYAGLSGDYNLIHTNAHFSAENMFGQRVAHGMLGQTIAVGLAVRSGIIEGTVLAFRDASVKFTKPIFIGDTVHVVINIAETKPLGRVGGGNVVMNYRVLNQDGVTVQRGSWTMLVANRPAETTEA